MSRRSKQPTKKQRRTNGLRLVKGQGVAAPPLDSSRVECDIQVAKALEPAALGGCVHDMATLIHETPTTCVLVATFNENTLSLHVRGATAGPQAQLAEVARMLQEGIAEAVAEPFDAGPPPRATNDDAPAG